MSRRSTRRQFLQQSALTGIGFWVAGGVSVSLSKSPNQKLNIAGIGVGGKGSSDVGGASHVGNIVALCDIDDNSLNNMAKQLPDAKKYHDFRQMLHDMGDKIDAVTVSTADHTHAPASVAAMRLKKHVYCQKPLTWSVHEARVMRQVAREMGVCTQMGNQGSAEDGLRRAVEIIQAGVIGPIKEIHVWTNRPIWPQAPKVTARPKETEKAPKEIHWDLFLGPAPQRPYSKAYHPFAWRGWRDFGTGALGDMACHTANMAYRALKLDLPIAVEAEHDPINPETFQGWATIIYHFPARGDMPACKLTWWEGHRDGKRNLPEKQLFHGEGVADSGSLLVGEKGTLYSPNDYGAAYVLLPKKAFKDYKGPEKTLPRNGRGDDGMKEEWARAIHEGKPEIAYSNFDVASRLTETMLLGNVAIVADKKIEYDGENMKIPNYPEAERLLKRVYRDGWKL
jgi:predicted dehydrogenase